MSSFSLRVVCIFLTSFGLVACGPVPGGTLSGTPTRAPEDWSTLLDEGHGFCEIESRPSEPHSIQLDCFLYQDQIYVQSHRWALESWWPVESWASIWVQAPMVRLRIGRQIFELRAVHISDPAERLGVLKFRGYDPIPNGIAAFRFEPRS